MLVVVLKKTTGKSEESFIKIKKRRNHGPQRRKHGPEKIRKHDPKKSMVQKKKVWDTENILHREVKVRGKYGVRCIKKHNAWKRENKVG